MMKDRIIVDKLPFFKYIRLAIIGGLIMSIALNLQLFVENLALKELLNWDLNASKEIINDLTEAKVIELIEK